MESLNWSRICLMAVFYFFYSLLVVTWKKLSEFSAFMCGFRCCWCNQTLLSRERKQHQSSQIKINVYLWGSCRSCESCQRGATVDVVRCHHTDTIGIFSRDSWGGGCCVREQKGSTLDTSWHCGPTENAWLVYPGVHQTVKAGAEVASCLNVAVPLPSPLQVPNVLRGRRSAKHCQRQVFVSCHSQTIGSWTSKWLFSVQTKEYFCLSLWFLMSSCQRKGIWSEKCPQTSYRWIIPVSRPAAAYIYVLFSYLIEILWLYVAPRCC